MNVVEKESIVHDGLNFSGEFYSSFYKQVYDLNLTKRILSAGIKSKQILSSRRYKT